MRRVFVLLVLLTACKHQSDLPKLFPVPDAKLVSESGQPLRLASLKGNVVVYDFIFTNCAGTCPMMTATLRKVTAKVGKNAPVRFVSISVDPKRDTPAYAAKALAPARRTSPPSTAPNSPLPTKRCDPRLPERGGGRRGGEGSGDGERSFERAIHRAWCFTCPASAMK